MIKAAVAIGSATILAGLISALPAPKVEAGTPATEVRVATLDLAAQKPSAGCSQRAWPYYEQGCATDFDARWRGAPRQVRLVTTDRLR